MIRYVTQGGVKLKRYVSLHRGEGVKNDQNWRYVIFGRPAPRHIDFEMKVFNLSPQCMATDLKQRHNFI